MRFDEVELEAVPLGVDDPPPDPPEAPSAAPRYKRLLAILTDLSLFAALALALSPLLPQPQRALPLAALAGFVLMISYYYFVGAWMLWGRTIGGAIFDVRVSTSSLGDATKRWALLLLSVIAIATAVVIAACDRDSIDEPPPPRQLTSKPGSASVPLPPPPREAPTRFEYPLDRFPPKPPANEPIRDPAVRPALLESVPPSPTAEARKAGVRGIVILEVVVEPDGRIRGGRVLKPLPFGLTQQAIDTVRQWRYSPGKNERGAPVRCLINATVEFK